MTDGQTDGRINRQTDRQTDTPLIVNSRSSVGERYKNNNIIMSSTAANQRSGSVPGRRDWSDSDPHGYSKRAWRSVLSRIQGMPNSLTDNIRGNVFADDYSRTRASMFIAKVNLFVR